VLGLPFRLRNLGGEVQVELRRNGNPERLGCAAHAFGFPVMTASVTYAGAGYSAALGWIQLVRSSDGEAGFALDPFEPLGRPEHPFCFFGFCPTLFDAPSRPHREQLEWLAHSFLCFIEDSGQQEARAVLGFCWGFSIRAHEILYIEPRPLTPDEWNQHLPLLRREHPRWGFAPGYQEC
jgi:hypothetical protein